MYLLFFFFFVEYGPAMIEDIILEAKLDPNMKVATDFDTSEGKLFQAITKKNIF